MREKRLLDRIRTQAQHPGRRITEDSKSVIRSVREHLQRILNTRQGNAAIAVDYGIPDLTDFMTEYPESLRDFERSIRQTLQKYEPRLKSIRVKFVPQDDDLLSLSFQIVARLKDEKGNNPVVFESVMDSDGKIKITR